MKDEEIVNCMLFTLKIKQVNKKYIWQLRKKYSSDECFIKLVTNPLYNIYIHMYIF